MIKSFIKDLDNKKVKMFSLFLAFSFLSWTVSKLSETYDSWVSVALKPVNIPDSLQLKQSEPSLTKIRVKANGFTLLGMGIGTSTFDLDVSEVDNSKQGYSLSKNKVNRQLQKSLSGTAEVLDVDAEQLYFDLYQVTSKKVPVVADLSLKYEPNHVLKEGLVITPDSVWIKGPSSEIEAINVIKSESLELVGLNEGFTVNVPLLLPDELSKSELFTKKVTIAGEVVRFSEKLFPIPITVRNVPEGYTLRTFPKEVSLLCKATEADLLKFKSEDFLVLCTYDSTRVASKMLQLSIAKQPTSAFGVKLMQNQVEYLLEPK